MATLFLASGVAGTIDLGPTLPSGIQRGGTFGVSASGKALPSGMTLTPSGVLSIGSAAVGQSAAGVVFTYQEP